MSATNRGAVRNRDDLYVTPVAEIEKFLTKFSRITGNGWFRDSPVILDPCAGGDEDNPMSYPAAIERWLDWDIPYQMITMDIRDDSRADIKGIDYLEYGLTIMPDIIISNPPYALAQQFIEKALEEAQKYVIFFLRLNFLGSQRRAPWWQYTMPSYIFVHPKRPSFTGDGRTDATEYAHFVWDTRLREDYTRLFVLPE